MIFFLYFQFTEEILAVHERRCEMAKQRYSILTFVAWFTGVVVSLAVGFGLINGTLVLPNWLGGASQAGMWVTVFVGWIVVLTTLASAVMALLQK